MAILSLIVHLESVEVNVARFDVLRASKIESSLQGQLSEGLETIFGGSTNVECELVTRLDVIDLEFEHLDWHALLMFFVDNRDREHPALTKFFTTYAKSIHN